MRLTFTGGKDRSESISLGLDLIGAIGRALVYEGISEQDVATLAGVLLAACDNVRLDLVEEGLV